MRTRQVGTALIALVALAGCGSTVQVRSTAGQDLSGGLSTPTGAAAIAITGNNGAQSVADNPGSIAGGNRASSATPSTPGSSTGQTTVTAGAARGAAVPGATCVVGHPIRVGYTAFNTAGLGAAGASNQNNALAGVDGSQAVDEAKRDMGALITYANTTGGVHGCRVVGYPIEMSEQDIPQSSRDALCVQATEDDKVQAYIDNNGFFTEQDFACLANHHVNYVGWGDTTDQTFMRAHAPYITTTLGASDRLGTLLVQGLSRGGYFNGVHKVGVIVDDLPTEHAVYDHDIAPAMQALGLTPTVAYVSPLDESQQQSQTASAVLSFRSQNIDHVIFQANILVFESFTNNAQSQQWFPRYGLNDYQLLANAAAGFATTSQMTNAMAVSSLPGTVLDSREVRPRSTTVDYGTTTGPNDSPGFQACIAVLSKETHSDYHHGSSGRSPSFFTFCDHFFLWLKAARAAPDTLPAHWGEGLATLGTSYPSSAVHSTRFGPGIYDGASDYRIGIYASDVTSCSCYRATSEPWYAMPS